MCVEHWESLPIWSQETWVSAAMAELGLSDTMTTLCRWLPAFPSFIFPEALTYFL